MAGKTKPLSKSKLPKPFEWDDTLIEAIQKRAHGHARSGALLARVIARTDGRGPAMDFMFHLSHLGFYGKDIWYGFENYCRSDIDMFIAVIEIEDKGFYNFILDWKGQQALEALKGKDV
jgi:hypothetical protein